MSHEVQQSHFPLDHEQQHKSTLQEQALKPVRVTTGMKLLIGDDEFPYPIAEGSIKVERLSKTSRHNLLTLTLVVGEVTMGCEDA
jgi:hypothetical protein